MRTRRVLAVVGLLAGLLASLVASVASADPLYLRSGLLLSPVAPPDGATTAALSASIGSGEEALMGTFATPALQAPIETSDTQAVVFVGTGRPGMDGCARVTAMLVRLQDATETVVAEGSVHTSVVPRKNITGPIVVPMALHSTLLALDGQHLVLRVRVGNECGGSRNVFLLYDSVARSSRVEMVPPGATTTTTTVAAASTTTTSTTLPPSCLESAKGLAVIRCRLEAIDGVLRGTSPADVGGARLNRRLIHRNERALALVRAAERGGTSRRRVRRIHVQLTRFMALVQLGKGDGRVAFDIGVQLQTLAIGATGELDALFPHS